MRSVRRGGGGVQALYGVSELAELQFRVRNVRREIAERRALDKAEDRAEAAAKRKAVSSSRSKACRRRAEGRLGLGLESPRLGQRAGS